MEFLKKNYEKLLLGVVLLLLAVSVLGFMLVVIPAHNEDLNKEVEKRTSTKVDPLPDLQVGPLTNTLFRLATPATISFSDPNKLFNPVQWQMTVEQTLKRAANLGPDRGLTITNITPLYLRLRLETVFTNEDNSFKYGISIERQNAQTAAQRRVRTTYCKLNEPDQKENLFRVVEVKGNPGDPDQLTLKLTDTDETAVLTKDKEKPFLRVEGYMANINYDPEHQKWRDQRVGAPLRFNGEDYIIVAITQNEVVLSAKSNQKKWTIKYNKATT